MFSTSVLEISKSALKKNLAFLRRHFGQNVRISSVVKGNAYGHDIETFVNLAEECGVDHFSVFSADEALDVFGASSKKSTIMIMGHINNEELEWAINNDIEFWVFETDRLEHALKVSKKLKMPARIHLEVETGMNRTGLNKKDFKSAISLIKNNPDNFILEGLCTHYAGAESIANFVRIKKQIKSFNRLHKLLLNRGLKPNIRHTACSAASIIYPQTRMDMVRIGIMQYGYWPNQEVFIQYTNRKKDNENPLQRIISWKTKIMSTKKVKKGEFIGYGINYQAQDDMKIAIIPVGYSTGFSRALSYQGRVLIKGHRVDITGIVNMNSLLATITKIPDAKKGDEVVLIGEQNGNEITVSSFSAFINMHNYETLTRLPRNIPRVVIE